MKTLYTSITSLFILVAICTAQTVSLTNISYTKDSNYLPATRGSVAINLSSFSAVKANTFAALKWSTKQELNSNFFVVERVGKTGSWQNIANIPASNYSSGIINYSFDDPAPLRDINLYRIKMVDKDGRLAYSDTRQVDFGNTSSYKVYPNPAQDFIQVIADKETNAISLVQVVDSKGQVVIQKQVVTATQPLKIHVAGLPTAIYHVRIAAPGDTPTVLAFVKQ